MALARKYRPGSLDEVVGQEAVGRTLRGALRAGRIPAAFLFAGPRGVGKTTMARILARALNCAASDGPTADPCGTCAPCREVADGSSLDVVEVDAASHNGVDDVREIRERVAHVPARARFKVYILDEAHMFSTAAWNAFLKTLEEPPPHARFVFATTEPEKVPETIVSRCQRFDFRRIHSADIVRTLAGILEKENRERASPLRASPAALETIARFARGGLRDAESLLEQALLAGEGEVREEDLAALLGTVPRERVREVLEAAFAGDAAATLRGSAAVHGSGADAATFLGQALELLRECLTLSVAGPTTPLVDTGDGERKVLADLAAKAGRAGLLRAVQILAETLRLVKATDEERPLVEAGLLRIALGAEVRTAGEILEALRGLEARLAGGRPPDPPPAVPRGVPGAAAPVRAPAAEVLFAGERAAPAPGEAAPPPDGEALAALWPKVVEAARTRIKSLGAFLAAVHAVPGSAPGRVLLEFPRGMAFQRRQCEDPERRSALEATLREVSGAALSVEFGFRAEGDAAPEAASGPPEPAAESFDRIRTSEKERMLESPVVKAVETVFRVKMVHVEKRSPAAEAGSAGPVEDVPEEVNE